MTHILSDADTYHQLIEEFFTYKSKEYKDSELKETFISQFLDYYRKFGFIETHESLRKRFTYLIKSAQILITFSIKALSSIQAVLIVTVLKLLQNSHLTQPLLH